MTAPDPLHVPEGRGHPYDHGDEERVPLLPIAGEPVRLGIVPGRPPAGAVVEIETRAGARERLALAPSDAAGPVIGAEGHLASAQAAAVGPAGWTATIPRAPEGPWRYRFLVTDPSGRESRTDWFPVESARWTPGPARGEVGRLRCRRALGDSIAWLTSSAGTHGVRFAMRLERGEHVVGLGERYDAIDQHGHDVDLRVFEQYKGQWRTPFTYFPVPFAHVVGAAGWGFHVAAAGRTRLAIASDDPDALIVEIDLGRAEPCPEVEAPVWDGSPQEVLAAYTARTGRGEELPEWVFGLWASGNEWNTRDRVMEQVERHEREGIPVSAVVIEAWSDEEGFCIFRDSRYRGDPSRPYSYEHFEFPADGAWPDPAGMVAELHDRGVRVILWQVPLQKDEPGLGAPAAAQRDALLESGHVVRRADGRPYANRGWWFPGALMPDLTTAQGARWWTSWRRYLVADVGVDGFKTDGGEHAWGRDLRFGDGSAGEAGANLYPVAYARAYGDLLRREGRAPVTFSRSGFTGSQAHGAFWAGDEDSTWEAFRAAIRAGLTASACGVVYWGWDIAGFSGDVPEAELYLRAWGASVFMPLMQYHSEFNGHRALCRDRTPWNVAERRSCPRLVDLARELVAVRQGLRPYLVEQAARALRGGKPLMRALFFETSDPAIWDYETEYLLGDDIVVNPVTEPGRGPWRTYAPAGNWIDPWTGERVDGGAVHERDYPLGEVPVLVRAERWGDLGPVFASGRPGDPDPSGGSPTGAPVTARP